MRKSKINYFDNNLHATVENKSFKVKGRRYGDLTLLDLFEINNHTVDTLLLDFNERNELRLTYIEKEEKNIKTFSGNFSKKGYYEIYFRKCPF